MGVITTEPGAWNGSLQARRISAAWSLPGFTDALGVTTEDLGTASHLDDVVRSPIDDTRRSVGDRVSAEVAFWRDRDQLRQDLKNALFARKRRIVSVTGRRGIGKSAAVAKVLAEFETADPNRSPLDDISAIAYLSPRTGSGALTLPRMFEKIAQLLTEPAAERLRRQWANVGSDALSELWWELRSRSVVVVLDNLQDVQDEDGRLVSDDIRVFLLSVCRTPAPALPVVVTTSVMPLNLDSVMPLNPEEVEISRAVVPLPLNDGLPLDDAVSLLREMDGDAVLESVPDADLAAAAAKVHGVPRGLEVLYNLVRSDKTIMGEVIESDEPPVEILVQLVSMNFQKLTGISRLVVSVLALAAVPIPEDAIPVILSGLADDGDVHRTVRKLATNRQIGPDAGAVRIHPLDGDYAIGELRDTNPALQIDLDRRLADWYAQTKKPEALWRELDDVNSNNFEFKHRWRAGDHDAAVLILADIAQFLARHGDSNALRSAIRAADKVPLSDEAEIQLHYCRFCAEFFEGSLDAAESAVREGWAAALKHGFIALAAQMEGDLGMVLRHQGRPKEAIEVLERLIGRSGNVELEVRTVALFELGLAKCYVNDGPGARAASGALVRAAETDPTPLSTGQAYDLLSLALLIDHDPAGAILAATTAIAAYGESPRQDNGGYVRNVKALAHLALDDIATAEAELRSALDTALEFRSERLEGFCATNLAWTLLRAGRREDAKALAAQGARRLAEHGVEAHVVGDELERFLSTDSVVSATQSLRRAVVAATENTDIYSPTGTVIEDLMSALT